jgi:hypothetical protein
MDLRAGAVCGGMAFCKTGIANLNYGTHGISGIYGYNNVRMIGKPFSVLSFSS